MIGEDVEEAKQDQYAYSHEDVQTGWRQSTGNRQRPSQSCQYEDPDRQQGPHGKSSLPKAGDEERAVSGSPTKPSPQETKTPAALPVARRLGDRLVLR